MLKRDLRVFIGLFGLFMLTFYITLYTMYPRAGDVFLPHVLKFNSWYTAIQSLFELSFTGSPAIIDLDQNWDHLSLSQKWDLGTFFFIYIFYGVLSVILLINLLIAMLSYTFESVLNDSTLSSRTAFSQCVMRLELLASSFGMSTAVGDHKGSDSYTYDFRSVNAADPTDPTASGETNAAPGNADPFAEKHSGPFARLEAQIADLQRQLLKVDQRIGSKLATEGTQNFKYVSAGHGGVGPGKSKPGGRWKALVVAAKAQKDGASPGGASATSPR